MVAAGPSFPWEVRLRPPWNLVMVDSDFALCRLGGGSLYNILKLGRLFPFLYNL